MDLHHRMKVPDTRPTKMPPSTPPAPSTPSAPPADNEAEIHREDSDQEHADGTDGDGGRRRPKQQSRVHSGLSAFFRLLHRIHHRVIYSILRYIYNIRNNSVLPDTLIFGHFLRGLSQISVEKNDGEIRIWRSKLVLKLRLIEVLNFI